LQLSGVRETVALEMLMIFRFSLLTVVPSREGGKGGSKTGWPFTDG